MTSAHLHVERGRQLSLPAAATSAVAENFPRRRDGTPRQQDLPPIEAARDRRIVHRPALLATLPTAPTSSDVAIIIHRQSYCSGARKTPSKSNRPDR
eukprot:CAMPEP_0172525314 /NCGR_PEP_ID=MMETSP1067-20121228/342_1 /TAXON_ID=265564 ORGANISM="Thalassiosira punctigera, Strain Tpunct2005C2" /NCGR_SAMPLE_ID=MMETSP1067 /ASSEMBLY_ACC=CAM_ASM_000444 /LENGTH=96 /DNA_ID=CAMNT_0013308537 /DNA_START=395 /DNA_END=682 /DNA_ORIENTATION=+